MKKLTILATVLLSVVTAASAQAASTLHRKHDVHAVKKVRLIQPLDKPASLPMPVDTFRA